MRRIGGNPVPPGVPSVRPQYPVPFPRVGFPPDTAIDINMNKPAPPSRHKGEKLRNQARNKLKIKEDPTDDGDTSVGERCFIEEAAKEAEVLLMENRSTIFHPSPSVLDFLSIRGLVPLSRPNPRLPWARWLCNVCKFHCKDLTKVREHLASPRHQMQVQRLQLEMTLKLLPPPTVNHLLGVQSMLDTVVTLVGLSPEELIHRATVTHQLEQLLRHHIPDCEVQMFGSSLSGFALHDSNLDLNLSSTKLLPYIAIQARVYKSLV